MLQLEHIQLSSIIQRCSFAVKVLPCGGKETAFANIVTAIGLAARFWQVGIEMRPFFNKSSLWAYPAYALGGASFGYWLQGVDDRQSAILTARKAVLLEKRQRKAEKDAAAAAEAESAQ